MASQWVLWDIEKINTSPFQTFPETELERSLPKSFYEGKLALVSKQEGHYGKKSKDQYLL